LTDAVCIVQCVIYVSGRVYTGHVQKLFRVGWQWSVAE